MPHDRPLLRHVCHLLPEFSDHLLVQLVLPLAVIALREQ
jgi:hypothetical protein